MAGYIAQVGSQRAFQQFQAVIEVVFECTCRGFIKRDCAIDGLLLLVHARLIFDHPLAHFVFGVGFRLEVRAGAEQDAEGSEAAQGLKGRY
ncbi:hypothetical protein D3C79_892060 [compost metagenome]